MNRFKRWAHATWITIAGALGIQYVRPPVMDVKPPVITTTATPTPQPTVAPPAGAKTPRLILGEVSGATPAETYKVNHAISLVNNTMATECFRNKFIAAKFTNTKGLTNEQIYNALVNGKRMARVEIFDGTWTQNYVYKTMGYDIGDGVTYVNRFYLSTDLILGSLIVHEALGHGSGFSHSSASDYRSVPYSLNNFIETCGKDLK